MKLATGECKYCKQMKSINVPDSWETDDVNAEVTRKCNCEEALAAEEVQRIITYAEADINRFFEDKGLDAFKEILKAAVEQVARKNVMKVSLNSNGYTATMKRTNSGISLTLKHTTEEKTES